MFRKRKDSSAMDRTNVERTDRSMSADSQGDSMAGSEGIDEPSMHEHNRMSTSGRGGNRQQGREGSTDDASDFGGMGGQRENSVDREGTGYTGSESTPETGHDRTGRSRSNRDTRTTERSGERSATDESESENPLT